MVNILKKAASGLLERMLNSATVIAVRVWPEADMHEVDLYLPDVDMDSWDSIKRLKCKVDELEYRDYTPVLWNSEMSVCTMFIDSGHAGAGSRWVRALKTGDQILFGAAHAAALPSTKGPVLCLADASALGHFLALKQLTDRSEHPMDVAVLLHGDYEIPEIFKAENPEFCFIKSSGRTEGIDMMEQWCHNKALTEYNSIYIAGNVSMTKALKSKLKSNPKVHARIKGYGFWS
ncbi:siderophore-interacting protein [Dyadobacter sp. LJ53]|uniref:siderophore-interacting protein n=1 Tax=Dyadobacter chenwenxiniae TaxID=2906456 RepID=UPI001F2FFFCE|nr:siderophore-interacting protein [Dyadobacter chenwenxiniae]MCF0050407.1 siderophore-interacting protein [Dyadobacter chenwenxiniae]